MNCAVAQIKAMPASAAKLRVSAVVEGGLHVGLPCMPAPLHPWGVAPALWVWRARCCAPPMLACRGTLNGKCTQLARPVGLLCFRTCLGRHASLLAVVGKFGIWQWKRDFRGHLLIRFLTPACKYAELASGSGSLTSAVICCMAVEA